MQTLKPLHQKPKGYFMDYILLPFGYMYNAEFVTAKKGQEMLFYGGETVMVDAVVKLPIKAPIADILCRLRYGVSMPRVLKMWQQNAIALGHGKGAVNTDECLMITYYGEEDICYYK